jgi:hypothetical protein
LLRTTTTSSSVLPAVNLSSTPDRSVEDEQRCRRSF